MVANASAIEWLIRLLAFIGGVVSTVIGSWISSKIRVYHDNRCLHLEKIKEQVLIPLSGVAAGEFAQLVCHSSPVIVEDSIRHMRQDARVGEDNYEPDWALRCENPWPSAFSDINTALYEDARRSHFARLILDTEALVASWTKHIERCRVWVEEMAEMILSRSRLKAFKPPLEPPYVLPHRLAVFAYRRLFGFQTGALQKRNQGNRWSLEGAPGLPGMSGSSALADQEQLDRLMSELDLIISEQREQAEALQRESRELQQHLARLQPSLQYAIASTRLRKRCDLVTFF